MKIYKKDGSFLDNFDDNSFGWSFDDDNTPPLKTNKPFSTRYLLKDDVIREETNLKASNRCDLKISKLYNTIVSKERLLNLIDPCTLEGKVLFAILFQNIKYISSSEWNLDVGLKIDHCVSLDNCKCFNIKRIEIRPQPANYVKFLSPNQLKLLRNDVEINKIHCEIMHLQKHFEKQTLRVEFLIREAEILKKDIKEVTFLNNLIYLLRGELDKVVFESSPFRLFLPPFCDFENNFIV